MVYMIIPTTNLVCVLFDPVIPTSSFNFIVFYSGPSFERPHKLNPKENGLPTEEGGAIGGALQ